MIRHVSSVPTSAIASFFDARLGSCPSQRQSQTKVRLRRNEEQNRCLTDDCPLYISLASFQLPGGSDWLLADLSSHRSRASSS